MTCEWGLFGQTTKPLSPSPTPSPLSATIWCVLYKGLALCCVSWRRKVRCK